MNLKDRNAPGTHEKVLSILAKLPLGEVLDAPAGEGAISQRLRDIARICAVDIDPAYFKLHNVPFCVCNLNEPLPFKDDFFDCIVSVEGIEHLENPFLCIREFYRVLKPGGNLVITTPNIMSIKSRTRFFFYSYHDFFRFIKPDHTYRHVKPEYEHEHINPMTFWELRHALQRAGFEIMALYTNRFVKAKRWGLLYPLIKRMVIFLTRKKYPSDPYITSKQILEGEILIIHACKP